MSFLAPLFLVGALAVAAPIIFHLIRRTSREKVTFSSLMFLQPTPPRVTRSSKVENIFLLLLRCLALCLLALGFARPFIQKPVAADNTGNQGRHIVVLLDASASMRRENLWTDARARAEQVVRDARPGDSVAIYAFDRVARPVLSFEQWTATPTSDRLSIALERLSSVEPGWSSTHLGHGLLTAVDALEESSGKSREAIAGQRKIVVISDLQEGAKLDGLQGFEWPRGIEVAIETVKARQPTNAGLQILADQDETQRPSGEQQLKLRVVNATDAKREQFQIGWSRPGEKSIAGGAVDVYVPPGQNRVVSAPVALAGVAAEQLRLTGDEVDFDNTAHYVPPKAEQIKVVFAGDDDSRDSQRLLYYLKRAFPETRRQIVQVIARPANAPIPADDILSAPLLIVGDVLTPESTATAREFLDNGKPVLLVMKSIASARTLADLTGLGGVAAEESANDGYALLGQLDFAHPLLAPFADPRFSDFTKIHFWKHRKLDVAQFKNARVIARFDKGDPALLEIPAGKGSLLVLTSGWNPADSQLALSSKFVPLLFSLLDLSGGVKAQLAQFMVGDVVPLGATNTAQSFSIRKPDGKELAMSAAGKFSETDLPGVYTILSGTSTQRFAVNLDPSESRTSPMPLEELERLRLPMDVENSKLTKVEEEKKLSLQATELEQRQKLWRWLLVAALVILVFETWLAGWLTRRNQQAPA